VVSFDDDEHFCGGCCTACHDGELCCDGVCTATVFIDRDDAFVCCPVDKICPLVDDPTSAVCCLPDEQCDEGACCRDGDRCGGRCCGDLARCFCDTCEPDLPTCAGDETCCADTPCVGGECCPGDRACIQAAGGPVCCSIHERCDTETQTCIPVAYPSIPIRSRTA
jgi:hypothetical protein